MADTLILRPNADVSIEIDTQYPASGSHYQKVDEEVADGDTTYLKNTAGGYQTDCFGLPNHTTESGAITEVRLVVDASKPAGSPDIGIGIKTHNIDYFEDKWFSINYLTVTEKWYTNPYTGSAWTWSEIDALQALIKLTENAKCTRIFIVVYYVVSPTVTTQSVTDVGGVVTGNGNITNNGGENCTKRGVCWNTTGNPTVADSKSEETGSFGTGAFTRPITGLSADQIYYVRAYAYNSAGYGYGSDVTVKTPTVTTQAVSDIGSVTATGNGNITATGGLNATKRGVCWNTTGSPTIADDKAEEDGSFGIGAFTSSMTGLDPGVTYYVKAYAINAVGVSYGAEVNFTTDKVAPTVTTQDATELSQNQVKGNGNITASGGENATERGFEYGLTKTPTWTKKETGSYEAGAFSLTIDKLQANTTYWYRAYAKNSIGTGYGEWVQFQTSASGTVPTGTKISICSDYSGNTYKLNSAFTDDGETYQSYFVLSTDLAQKQALHIDKRLEDLYSYFVKKDSGTAKIYVKRDNEAEWQYAGEISMVGDEDIIIKHLPSENEDTEGDVDFLAKTFLIKFVFENDFEFIGLITEAVPGE